jgi:D-arabinose 5-phosphate isomerase GutQ
MKKETMSIVKNSINTEAKAILDILAYLDEESFAKAVNAICKSERIITCASGSSGIAAKKLAHSLCCVERPAKFMSPAEAVHGGLGCVQQGDTVIMVSRGGKTVELLPIIDVVKKKKATLVAVTENVDSPLALNADILIPMHIEKETDRLNVMATASFVATIAIFDAIIVAVMEETDYKKEQFALIHPGGAVGELLKQYK